MSKAILRTFFVLTVLGAVLSAPNTAKAEIITPTIETTASSTDIDIENVLVQKVDQAKKLLETLTPNYKIYTAQSTYKKKKVFIKMLNREVILIGLNPKNQELKQITFNEVLALAGANRPAVRPPQILSQNDGCTVIWRSGSRWGFNRNISISCNGEDILLIGLKMPYTQNATASGIIMDSYIPYTPEMHYKTIVDLGKNYLEKVINDASQDLKDKKVLSRALPGKNITEVITPDFVMSLIVNEHMDHAEFLNAIKTNTFPKLVEKIWAIVGLNGDKAMRWSISSAGACCLTQFMPNTYKGLVKRYPEAGLDPALTKGRQEHINAVKATMVLFDSDIAYGWRAKTKEVCFSSQEMLGKCLAASYNGGPGTLNRVITRAGTNWDNSQPTNRLSGLRTETMVYLQKLANIIGFLKTTVSN